MVEREKFDHIEERLRSIEGGRDFAFANMVKLCLVPDVIIPPKFKVPDFDKYKATTCPKNLESSRVRSWKDLMAAFIRQYQYNSDMAPNRMQLQNMCKRE